MVKLSLDGRGRICAGIGVSVEDWCARLAAIVVLAAGTAQETGAIVGGTPNSGPLARGAIMVLTPKGGVCTGILIAPDIVLTAGYCVIDGSAAFLRVDGEQRWFPVTEWMRHPGYVPNAVKTRQRSIDLALLRLAREPDVLKP